MSKIRVIKVKNVECYDFESKTSIPFDKTIEVEKTVFIKKKIEEGILKEVTTKAKGGGKDDNSKGGKSKKES